MDIILASQSPRRRALLEQMGLQFRVLPSNADEEIDKAASPEEQVQWISRAKAEAVRAQVGDGGLIIAADTLVALEGEVLGKPRDRADAARMLSRLSGRQHQVYTGLTVLRGEQGCTEYEKTLVTFRTLTAGEMADYIATGEPMDKAGAYGIQGYGGLFVSGISGDYYNVMGLPVCRLGQVLSRFGVDCMALAAGRL